LAICAALSAFGYFWTWAFTEETAKLRIEDLDRPGASAASSSPAGAQSFRKLVALFWSRPSVRLMTSKDAEIVSNGSGVVSY
jgi:hypothetical protein